MSHTGGIGSYMGQLDEIAYPPGSSSLRHRLQHPPSPGWEAHPNSPAQEGVQGPLIPPTPTFCEVPKRQNSDQAPKSLGKTLPVSNPQAPSLDDNQERLSPMSIDDTPSRTSLNVPVETWVSETANHFHIGNIGNANFGDSYGIINQSFTKTLLGKLPDLEDERDPVKAILEIAKVVTEIREHMERNMDAVEIRIASTAAQLLIVEQALEERPDAGENNPGMKQFKSALAVEVKNLYQLQHTVGKFVNHESEKSQMVGIFERVNEARMRFELETSIRLYSMIYAIEERLKRYLKTQLEASDAADYKYAGEDQETLYRVPCTCGTRVRILDMIIQWANHGRQSIFWLFGPAGSGKSTIAYTIARRFELTSDTNDTIVLGGNFFCSRQVKEARHESQIIRTIAYHLALKCKPFADALDRSGKFDTVHQSVRAQIQGLLVGPWKESRSSPNEAPSSRSDYLIIIDAVDELVKNGAPRFLRNLLDVIKEEDLPGLKFFITSRQDPMLERHIESFHRKELYHLQNVGKEEVQGDIKLYLEEHFPHFVGCGEMKVLLTFADSLFICAATLARYLAPDPPRFTEGEQVQIVQKLSDGQATGSLDTLYSTIVSEAFGDYGGNILATRLDVLYTFLCAMEPTTTATVDGLLSVDSSAAVLSSLHAVLYTDTQHRILSYHKSFSDFMFDSTRCPKRFCCDTAVHHRRLTESCFRIMNAKPSGLRFNIANIPTSFTFDRDDDTFEQQVKACIPTVLDYSCRSWSHHLILSLEVTADDPLHNVLAEFLQLHVLFWIEAMNLLGCRGQCQAMLQTAGRWAGGHHTTLLAHQLTQVTSFALYFSGSPAALSTPHLYISSLATWRRGGEPFETWRKHLPGVPRFSTTGEKGASQLLSISLGWKVHAVALACNGTRILIGLEDGSVRVWSLTTSKEERVLRGHTGEVRSVASSSDGVRIVSGSDDCSMRVWNAETGVEEWMCGHHGSVCSVDLSNDGTRIVSASLWDTAVRVWDGRTGEVLMVLDVHDVQSVAFSRDGTGIASGTWDGAVRTWDAITGEVQNVLEGPPRSSVNSIAFSADGSRIVAGFSSGSVVMWNAGTGEEHWRREAPGRYGVSSVSFSADGVQVVAGLVGASMRVWNILTDEELEVLNSDGDAVNSVAFLGDGTQIVCGSDDGVRVWDPARAGESQRTLQGHTEVVFSVAFSNDGMRIASGSADKTICVWHATTGEQQSVLKGHTGFIHSVAFSNNSTRIVSGSGDNSIRLWDAMSGKQEKVLEGHTSTVFSVAFSNDGSRIVSRSGDKSVRVWDVATGEEQVQLWGRTISGITISSDGARIASGSDDHCIRVRDAVTNEEEKVLEGHTGTVYSVAFSNDGMRIVSASRDGSKRVWDVATGEEQMQLRGHTGTANDIAISSDGTLIAFGSYGNSIRVWDATTGEEHRVLKGHTGTVYSVAFSNDGTRIVSGSSDNSIRVWDLNLSYTSEVTRSQGRSSGEPTGWLLSPFNPDDYLMYVPPDDHLPQSPCVCVIGRKRPCSFVDFANAAIGDQWQNCYTP